MSENNSLSIQERWYLPLSSAGQILAQESGRRLPHCLTSPFLSFSPFSHSTRLQPDRLLNGASTELNCHSNSLLVVVAPSLSKRMASGHQSTVYEQHFGVKSNRGSASSRGRTGGGQRHWRPKKNDRDRNTHIMGNSLHVHCSSLQIPGKIWITTNQSRAISARAYASRELRARAVQASRGI